MRKRLILALPPLAAMLLPASAPLLAQTSQTPSFGDVAGRFFRDMQAAGEQAASETLAQWILASRNDAIKAGVSPIPAAIRAKLKGHFPEALLSRVRYRIGTGHDFSLQTNAFKGNAVAITLDEVILFRPTENVAANANLWAHELTHVQQYERWGVRGFARRYTLDYLAVEAEAEAAARKYAVARAGGASTVPGAR